MDEDDKAVLTKTWSGGLRCVRVGFSYFEVDVTSSSPPSFFCRFILQLFTRYRNARELEKVNKHERRSVPKSMMSKR